MRVIGSAHAKWIFNLVHARCVRIKARARAKTRTREISSSLATCQFVSIFHARHTQSERTKLYYNIKLYIYIRLPLLRSHHHCRYHISFSLSRTHCVSSSFVSATHAKVKQRFSCSILEKTCQRQRVVVATVCARQLPGRAAAAAYATRRQSPFFSRNLRIIAGAAYRFPKVCAPFHYSTSRV